MARPRRSAQVADRHQHFRVTPRLLIGTPLTIAAGIFLASNREKIAVDLLFFHTTLRLWIVLTVTFLVGAGVGKLSTWTRRIRRLH